MALHRIANPVPPQHAHQHTIQATISPRPGKINIYFYLPRDYQQHKSGKRYPLLVNFHGGGFTLGAGTDDCRWFRAVMEKTDAIIATIDYRLAPEYPFPTAVEDGVDAILWLVSRADELGIDLNRGIVLSGFSAGANLVFTIPLKLDQMRQQASEDINSDKVAQLLQKIQLTGLISWYPPTDYTITRPKRNATNPRPEAGLPRYLTSLFDQSYLHPPGCERDVLVSPALASDEQLMRALPSHIWIYTCEYDDLCDEGRRFAERLHLLGRDQDEEFRITTEGGRKIVRYEMIPGVPHAWDKAPNPLWVNEIAHARYQHAVEGLRRLWEGNQSGN